MLYIKKIVIRNFRPYYSNKVFDFGDEKGLSVIIGDNGVGKTSLIKALKYVLYGALVCSDDDIDFKIKNEINILAWEEQNFEMYVALDFIYNGDHYILKRTTRSKTGVSGFPKNDKDFEESISLQKNGTVLSKADIDKTLKNVIPREVSEYILFEGETISKYKDLLDNNKNLEIYESIRKILGINVLENSKKDLEIFVGGLEEEKIRRMKEQTKNRKLLDDLGKYTEEKEYLSKAKAEAAKNLAIINRNINDYVETLKNNRRTRELFEKKAELTTLISSKNEIVESERHMIKNNLNNYKGFCIELISESIKDYPPNISRIKKIQEENNRHNEEVSRLSALIDKRYCNNCGHEISNEQIESLKKEIFTAQQKIVRLSDSEISALEDYESRMSSLSQLLSNDLSNLEDDTKSILEHEKKIITLSIEKDKLGDELNSVNEQLKSISGPDDLDKIVNAHSIAIKNKAVYEDTIQKCVQDLQSIQNKISDIAKRNPAPIQTQDIDNKIKTAKLVLDIFSSSIERFSKEMRKKVQEDATTMFRSISENESYTDLAFDEHYGLKLIDRYRRVVPNVSSGYMTLITISLIYGLHKNSTLTGTIILDAPFSVLTNFHRDKIIEAFLTLSPQVVLLVYKDQINLDDIRTKMGEKLVKEFEIFQDRQEKNSSYKTQIREIER